MKAIAGTKQEAWDGKAIASFNNPSNTLSAKQITQKRSEGINGEVFASCFALLIEHFGVTPSNSLLSYYYRTLANEISNEEFEAACYDLFKTQRLRFSDVLGFLLEHVHGEHGQRSHIDLWQRELGEMRVSNELPY